MITQAGQRAAAEALELLAPHADSDPAIGALVTTLDQIAPDEDDSAELEKSMAAVQTTRELLAKAELSPSERLELTERNEKAARETQHEHMMRVSPGYAQGVANRAAEQQQRLANLGGRV
jgi:hypothetical protein